MELRLIIEGRAGVIERTVFVGRLVIAGWAARDKEGQEHHIQELEALGVARPKTTPTYYRVSASRLSTAPLVETIGVASSGEVEPVLIASDGALYVGVGSDHTDREVEAYGITVSKQMCDKPISAVFWPYEEVAEHWDRLMLRSYATIHGERVLYQEGPVSKLLAPRDLIAGFGKGETLADDTVMFCGTLPAIGGIRTASRFEGELEDPILDRSIHFEYDVATLPILG